MMLVLIALSLLLIITPQPGRKTSTAFSPVLGTHSSPIPTLLAQAGQVLGSLSVNLTASDTCGGSGEPTLHPKCSPASRAPAVHQGLP